MARKSKPTRQPSTHDTPIGYDISEDMWNPAVICEDCAPPDCEGAALYAGDEWAGDDYCCVECGADLADLGLVIVPVI